MQNDNIEIEKIWQDDDFFEVRVRCSSEIVTAVSCVYISDEQMKCLYQQLNAFLCDEEMMQIYWESGEKGDNTTASISFLFIRVDMLGHIKIEVFMELNDGGKLSEHNCRFYVDAEIGQLYNFLEQIPLIVTKDNIGYKISLN